MKTQARAKKSHQNSYSFHEIAELVPAMIAVYNIRTGKYLYVNSSIRKLVGYSPRTFTQKGLEYVSSLVHPDDVLHIAKQNHLSLEKANKRPRSPSQYPIVSFEYRMRHKNGSYRWLKTDVSVFSRDTNGQVECVLNVSVDITSRKVVEEKYKDLVLQLEGKVNERTQKLKASEKKFRALVEKSYDVTLMVDPKARLLYATPSIVRLFGREYEEFMGLPGIKFIHPSDIPKIVKALARLALRPNSCETLEFRIKHKEGYYIWVEATGTNLLHEPEVKAIVVNFHDITERKALEQRKNDFISIASHELKTPLTSIKLYMQILSQKASALSSVEAASIIEKMKFQLDQVTRLVGDLLDATKIQEGKLSFQKTRWNLSSLLKEIVTDFQLRSPTHQIALRCTFKGVVTADKFRLSQVVINLLSNAIKFSPRGSQIIVSARATKHGITISVRDFGIGISKKDQEKLFGRFFQAESKRKDKGLGLGLFISANIIEQHGGKLSVKSDLGKGSTFLFTLPGK